MIVSEEEGSFFFNLGERGIRLRQKCLRQCFCIIGETKWYDCVMTV